MVDKIRLKEKRNVQHQSIKIPHFFEFGTNIILDIYKILQNHRIHFKKILFLADNRTFAIGGNKVVNNLRTKGITVIKKNISMSNDTTIKKVTAIIRKNRPDLVMGFGGGKILDVAKITAARNRIRFISIPTILSNDGIASPVAVITNKKGIPVSHLTVPAYGIIIDFNIIKKGPIRHLRAGVGDLISNLSAVFDCRLARKRKQENIDPAILKLAEVGAQKLLKLKIKNIKNKEFLEALCDGLLKSGLAMCLVGSSRPASGSEHKISHSLDFLYPGRKTLHGEQVGIATIFTMVLQKNSFIKPIRKLYKKINFPMKLKYLGLTRNEFFEVVLNAKKIRPERFTILEDKKLNKNLIIKLIKKLAL